MLACLAEQTKVGRGLKKSTSGIVGVDYDVSMDMLIVRPSFVE